MERSPNHTTEDDDVSLFPVLATVDDVVQNDIHFDVSNRIHREDNISNDAHHYHHRIPEASRYYDDGDDDHSLGIDREVSCVGEDDHSQPEREVSSVGDDDNSYNLVQGVPAVGDRTATRSELRKAKKDRRQRVKDGEKDGAEAFAGDIFMKSCDDAGLREILVKPLLNPHCIDVTENAWATPMLAAATSPTTTRAKTATTSAGVVAEVTSKRTNLRRGKRDLMNSWLKGAPRPEDDQCLNVNILGCSPQQHWMSNSHNNVCASDSSNMMMMTPSPTLPSPSRQIDLQSNRDEEDTGDEDASNYSEDRTVSVSGVALSLCGQYPSTTRITTPTSTVSSHNSTGFHFQHGVDDGMLCNSSSSSSGAFMGHLTTTHPTRPRNDQEDASTSATTTAISSPSSTHEEPTSVPKHASTRPPPQPVFCQVHSTSRRSLFFPGTNAFKPKVGDITTTNTAFPDAGSTDVNGEANTPPAVDLSSFDVTWSAAVTKQHDPTTTILLHPGPKPRNVVTFNTDAYNLDAWDADVMGLFALPTEGAPVAAAKANSTPSFFQPTPMNMDYDNITTSNTASSKKKKATPQLIPCWSDSGNCGGGGGVLNSPQTSSYSVLASYFDQSRLLKSGGNNNNPFSFSSMSFSGNDLNIMGGTTRHATTTVTSRMSQGHHHHRPRHHRLQSPLSALLSCTPSTPSSSSSSSESSIDANDGQLASQVLLHVALHHAKCTAPSIILTKVKLDTNRSDDADGSHRVSASDASPPSKDTSLFKEHNYQNSTSQENRTSFSGVVSQFVTVDTLVHKATSYTEQLANPTSGAGYRKFRRQHDRWLSPK